MAAADPAASAPKPESFSFSSRPRRSASFFPMPGIVARTRAFWVAIARTRSGSGRPESTVSATFGPTPETEIRRSKTYFSCFVANPKSESASSRTCMCT